MTFCTIGRCEGLFSGTLRILSTMAIWGEYSAAVTGNQDLSQQSKSSGDVVWVQNIDKAYFTKLLYLWQTTEATRLGNYLPQRFLMRFLKYNWRKRTLALTSSITFKRIQKNLSINEIIEYLPALYILLKQHFSCFHILVTNYLTFKVTVYL